MGESQLHTYPYVPSNIPRTIRGTCCRTIRARTQKDKEKNARSLERKGKLSLGRT